VCVCLVPFNEYLPDRTFAKSYEYPFNIRGSERNICFKMCIALKVFLLHVRCEYFNDTGTKEVLPFRKEACCTGATKYSERSISDYHCRVAESSGVVEKLDQILVCSQARTAAAV